MIIDPAMDDYSQKVSDLFDSQFGEWPLVNENYRQLKNVLVRTIAFPAFEIKLQYNPGRITSSSARVDAGSIEARPCFLCEKNRPQEQRGVPGTRRRMRPGNRDERRQGLEWSEQTKAF